MRKTQDREVCVLLPDKQHLDCAVGVKARGREVFGHVTERLGINGRHLFGLAVVRDNEYLFLDLEQKLNKYFGKEWRRRSLMGPFVLFLRVQYYVESGRLILAGEARRLYYAELKHKVLGSQSHQQEALFFQLAAFALQADLGDLPQRCEEEEEEAGDGGEDRREKGKYRHYFLPEDYYPSWLIKRRGRDFLLQHGPPLHNDLRGVSRDQAILRFITEAGALQDGPVTFYSMRQEEKERKSSVILGLVFEGIQLYQDVEGKRCLLYDFSWNEIDRITFKGRRFEIDAVASLCLPKLVYIAPSAFHSKHILRHLSDNHRLRISTRDTVRYVRLLEERQASQSYREAYICDLAAVRRRLCISSGGHSLPSPMSDYTVAMPTTKLGPKQEQEGPVREVEMCVDEPEEVLVDDPAEVSWLAERYYGVSVDGPLVLPPSCWADIADELKQVLKRKANEGISVD